MEQKIRLWMTGGENEHWPNLYVQKWESRGKGEEYQAGIYKVVPRVARLDELTEQLRLDNINPEVEVAAVSTNLIMRHPEIFGRAQRTDLVKVAAIAEQPTTCLARDIFSSLRSVNGHCGPFADEFASATEVLEFDEYFLGTIETLAGFALERRANCKQGS